MGVGSQPDSMGASASAASLPASRPAGTSPTWRFTVDGEPRGKGRPRAVIYKGKDGKMKPRTYTPLQTASYENLIKLVAMQVPHPPFAGAVQVVANAYFRIPKSARRRDVAAMVAGVMRPTRKPDADNIIKSLLDALNEIAFADDVQVVDVTLRKWWTADAPRLEVKILSWVAPAEVAR